MGGFIGQSEVMELGDAAYEAMNVAGAPAALSSVKNATASTSL